MIICFIYHVDENQTFYPKFRAPYRNLGLPLHPCLECYQAVKQYTVFYAYISTNNTSQTTNYTYKVKISVAIIKMPECELIFSLFFGLNLSGRINILMTNFNATYLNKQFLVYISCCSNPIEE